MGRESPSNSTRLRRDSAHLWVNKHQGQLAYELYSSAYSNLIVNLPQPNQGSRPDTATVFSEAGASMVNAKARGGALMQNGVR